MLWKAFGKKNSSSLREKNTKHIIARQWSDGCGAQYKSRMPFSYIQAGPKHHIPPLVPSTSDEDPIPVTRPPPPPTRPPPEVVVKPGAGKAAKGLRGPPEGGLPGKNK